MSKNSLSSWDLKENHLHSDCRIFEVYKQRLRRRSDGLEGEFFVLDTNSWVNVLAITPNKELVLVRQFRYGSKEFSLEPPWGVIEKGEDPIEAGLRELKEETGVYATDWKHLLSMHLSNSVSDELAIVYLATGLKECEAAPEDTEDLYTRQVSLEEAWQMVENGIITDSMSVAAITKIKLMKVLGQL